MHPSRSVSLGSQWRTGTFKVSDACGACRPSLVCSMNPSIPPEFYVQSKSTWEQWHATDLHNEGLLPFPAEDGGSWNPKKVLPLQVLLLQQILENPDLIATAYVPDTLVDWLFYHLEGSGRLTERIVSSLARNAVALDLCFLPSFKSLAWFPQLASLPQLRYESVVRLQFTTLDSENATVAPHRALPHCFFLSLFSPFAIRLAKSHIANSHFCFSDAAATLT